MLGSLIPFAFVLEMLSVIGAEKRGGADDPSCYSKKFESLKNWNNHFFWIDASVCPLSTSWFSSTSIVKDPLPVDEAVDLPCVELLSSAPTLLHDNDKEIGLLDFVKSADPFKVKVGKRTLIENEVSLITETKDMVISPSLRTISLVDHTIQDELNVNSGKRMKRVAFVSRSPPGEQAADGSGSAAPTIEDVTSSSVTPTPERVLEDALHDNVRMRPPSGCFVVLSSGSADTDIPATSQ
ncbi:hypothetical protein Tco_1061248, partial [Tanacetum coccineum]